MGSDSLTTGSERLARSMRVHYKVRRVNIIKSDPGVKALVETMERFRDGIYLRNEFQDHCIAALKAWETGK